MVTNTGPRPYVPGCPVQLEGLSTDAKPTEWLGKPVANGSTFKVIDKDEMYKYDEENKTWYIWTQDGGSGGGGGHSDDNIATDTEADEMITDLLNKHRNNGEGD